MQATVAPAAALAFAEPVWAQGDAGDVAVGEATASRDLGSVGEASAPDAAPEQASSATGWFEVIAASAYVWRGDLYSEDLFEPSLQPDAELGVPGVGPGSIDVSVWAFHASRCSAHQPGPALSPS
ncbi:MAG: hypothetical protein JW751_04795 [Polyangiaceae bacterium]|nr:hypothetical protein [Polyangiaceae bacterium]